MLFRTAIYLLAVVHETRMYSCTFQLLGTLGEYTGVTVRKYEVPALCRLLQLLSLEFITAMAVSYTAVAMPLHIFAKYFEYF